MDYSALAQGIMSAVGMMLEAGERQKAQMLLDSARQRFEGIKLPTIEELSQQLGPSAMEGVRPDAQADSAQRETLRQALQVAATGFGPEDEAALTETGNRVAQQQRNTRAGIEQSMAARGGIGSGADYALQANAADTAAQQLGQNQKNIQAEALRRRMQGLSAASGMAGTLRGQVGDEDRRRAAARDLINAQNAQYRRGAYQTNFEQQMGQANAIAGASGSSANQMVSNGQFGNRSMNDIGAGAYDFARAAAGNGGNNAGSQPYADAAHPAGPGDWTNYGQSDPNEWTPWGGG